MIIPTAKSLEAESSSTYAQNEPNPPEYEEPALQESLNHLQRATTAYYETEQRGHEPSQADAQRVADAMHNFGDRHRDTKTRDEWHHRAHRFSKAGRKERRGMLSGLGPIGMLIALPFMLAGRILHVAGGILHTTGAVLGGVGDAFRGDFREDSSDEGHRRRRGGRRHSDAR
ncbi:hypothetical protein H0H92_011804 [Tricholoma furcatifolium]|nr:hypothetical protein H0H92_011804 [Tricholoma furcatifolium]